MFHDLHWRWRVDFEKDRPKPTTPNSSGISAHREGGERHAAEGAQQALDVVFPSPLEF